MIKKQLQTTYFETTDLTDFNAAQNQLIQDTIQFAKQAYAPYSNFNVSAGLLLDDGTILKGTNVENASYPVSICAERTVLSHAISNYPQLLITAIAIYVDKELDQPIPPCGLCRQTLVEAEQRQGASIRLIMISKNGTYIVLNSCSDLLPLSFNSNFLDE